MKFLPILLLMMPICAVSQTKNLGNSDNYTDDDIVKFATITQNWVSIPIPDDEIKQIIKDAGITLDEYKTLLTKNNFGLAGTDKTLPLSKKEIKLARLIADKNKEKVTEKEKLLSELCEKHKLSIAKYKALKMALTTDEKLKQRVIDAFNK